MDWGDGYGVKIFKLKKYFLLVTFIFISPVHIYLWYIVCVIENLGLAEKFYEPSKLLTVEERKKVERKLQVESQIGEKLKVQLWPKNLLFDDSNWAEVVDSAPYALISSNLTPSP